jgi:hypothetical protein
MLSFRAIAGISQIIYDQLPTARVVPIGIRVRIRNRFRIRIPNRIRIRIRIRNCDRSDDPVVRLFL